MTATTAVVLAMVALVMVTAAVRLATVVALVMATAVQVVIGNSLSERLMITHAFA